MMLDAHLIRPTSAPRSKRGDEACGTKHEQAPQGANCSRLPNTSRAEQGQKDLRLRNACSQNLEDVVTKHDQVGAFAYRYRTGLFL